MRSTPKDQLVTLSLLLSIVPMTAATGMSHGKGKMVAFDAKDKRYYSVAYAKAHGMHDRGGDRLIVMPMSSLPQDAKMSRAMHGKM